MAKEELMITADDARQLNRSYTDSLSKFDLQQLDVIMLRIDSAAKDSDNCILFIKEDMSKALRAKLTELGYSVKSTHMFNDKWIISWKKQFSFKEFFSNFFKKD